jgi:large subunit ribosomal protein L2
MSKYIKYFLYNIKKKLCIGVRPMSGRNYLGKICVHHQSGGNKKKYIYIDFFRRINSYGYIYKVIKCSNRTALIGGIIYENGLFSHIIISETIKLGSKIYSGTIIKNDNDYNIVGNSVIIKKIKLFSIVNNIEKYPFSGGSLIRAAGSSAIITTKINDKVMLKLKSG